MLNFVFNDYNSNEIHPECMESHMEIDLHAKMALIIVYCYLLLLRPSQKLESKGAN